MTLFTNFFGGSKSSTPIRKSSPPRASRNVTSNQTDEEDWEVINPHEAGVFYDDQITLLLGPRRETRLQILLTDIPKASGLLNTLRNLHPSHRTMSLFLPDLQMVKSYLNPQSISADALAVEMPWLDIIKLAATADVFQDTHVQGRALAALKEKVIIAFSTGKAVSLFENDDFAFAYTYHTKTGSGEKLIQTLRDIQATDTCRTGLTKVKLPAAEDRKPQFGGVKQKASDTRYGNSMLKGMGLVAVKKVGDGKVYPVRQPTVPPNLEYLKRGDVRNFIWLDKKDTSIEE